MEGSSTLDCGANDANCNGGSGTNGTCTKAAKKTNDTDAEKAWNDKCKAACETKDDGTATGCVMSNGYDTTDDGGMGGTCAERKTPPPATNTYENKKSKGCHCKKGPAVFEGVPAEDVFRQTSSGSN
jgi:hypothetical protein